MVATSEHKLIGVGLYTPAELARYARVPTSTVTGWFFGRGDRGAVVDPQLAQSDERVLSFLDFVQAMAIRAIRKKHGVSLQKIRQAVGYAQDHHGIQYPFARDHKTFLFGGDVHIYVPGAEPEDEWLVQVTGHQQGQGGLPPVMELYMDDLTFDHETGLASQYCAFSRGDRSILMDPKVRFGQPYLECGYEAQTLIDAARIEGGPEAAAAEYEVDVDDVKLALRFDDHLRGCVA